MRILVIAGVLASAIAAAVIMTNMRPEPPKKETVVLDPLVQTITLENMTANFSIGSQGTVRPRTETILSAEVSGTIVAISPKFVAGGVFQADEVLLRIDPTNYEVALEQADALIAQRTIEYEGAKKLRNQGYRAESELASATAALAAARAERVRANRNLERTKIRLPYDGMVRAKETDLGQFVNAGSRVGVVFATDFAEVRLPLTDLDLAYVDLPDAAAIRDKGQADGPDVLLQGVRKGEQVSWPAKIVRTEGVVDENSRVTYAVAEIADPYKLESSGVVLPVGSFVSAQIQGKVADNVIRVPRGLVRGSNELVFVDEKDELRIRNVEIVRADAEDVYISGGARPGDRVVTTVLESAINGLKVRIAGTE